MKYVDMLDSTPLGPLLTAAHERTYPKGQIILYQGDLPPHLFVLRSGRIKMYDIDEQGNEKIVHILRTPSIFPFASYFGRPAETIWFYAALTDVEACVVPYDELHPKMQTDAQLNLYLLSQVSVDLHELFVRLTSMSKTTTRPKLIAALKFLCVHHATIKTNSWRRVAFPISHQLLADMTGITRESATLAMQQLQEEKIVRSPRLGVLEIDFKKLITC